MAYTTINISVPEGMKVQIESEVRKGHFASTSDFVRDIVRDYLEEKRIEALLIEGLQDRDISPLTSRDFVEMKSEAAERLSKRAINPVE